MNADLIDVETVDAVSFMKVCSQLLVRPVPNVIEDVNLQDLVNLLSYFTNLESVFVIWFGRCSASKRNKLFADRKIDLMSKTEFLYEAIRAARNKRETASRLYTIYQAHHGSPM